MKKTIFFLAALATLVACNKSAEVAGEAVLAGQTPIKFGIESTKAFTESTVDVLKTNGFKVAGVTSAKAVLFNDVASYVEAKSYFTTEKVYYYPTTGTISFYALYPQTKIITVTDGAATYAHTQDVDADVIAAKATEVSSPETDQSVALTFGHILSRVGFTVKGADSNVTYMVKSIKVNGYASGTYAYVTNTWGSLAATKTAYSAFSGEQQITTTAAALGTVQSFIPGTLNAEVEWDVYSGSILIASYKADTDFTPTMGKTCTVNLTLSNSSAKIITFTIDVTPWGTENQNYTLE